MTSQFTEFELIAKLTADAPREAPGLVCGVGDDCAVVRGDADRDWLVTTDALLEGVHFRREWTDLAALGRKAVAVNVSDVAAMGGSPRFYLVTLGLPEDVGMGDASALYAGMRERADAAGMILIGGDTTGSREGLVISVTVIGEVARERCCYRRGAHAGDSIYVTGTFGSAALGLACLTKGEGGDVMTPYLKRHFDPLPRLAEGRMFAGTGHVTAMIDVSDGLVADLEHIAEASGVGFEIDASAVPLDDGFERAASRLGLDPVQLALTGGEEYELLFTVAGDAEAAFERQLADLDLAPGVDVTRIGRMVGEKGTRIVLDRDGKRIELKERGYDHLRRRGI